MFGMKYRFLDVEVVILRLSFVREVILGLRDFVELFRVQRESAMVLKDICQDMVVVGDQVFQEETQYLEFEKICLEVLLG